MTKRLKDYTIDVSKAEFDDNLKKFINKIGEVNNWIEEKIERSDISIVLSNLLSSTASYLDTIKLASNPHISIIALATRSVYEINVRIRAVLSDNEELKKWQSEAVTDKVKILLRLLELSQPLENVKEQEILRQEIDRLENLIKKYGLPTVKEPENTGKLVKKVGLENEHFALYSFYSKLVHPSSYLVNDYKGASSLENQNILLVHMQFYAHDSLSRVCEKFDISDKII